MEGTFFFGEQVRWNLGWENPNPAGAFIATLIPLLWGVANVIFTKSRPVSLLLWLFLSLELALWYLLSKTYSRGALVGVCGAGILSFLFFEFTVWRSKTALAESTISISRRPTYTARVLGIIILLFATQFIGRIEPRYVSSDASAGNRLTLWKGGLQMIAVEPWTGWGIGESGVNFMHWFQPVNESAAYAGMVNSYLHVGVERGLPFLALCTTILGGFILLSARLFVRRAAALTGFQLGAGASLLAFLLANIFSTLWIFENLWWVPLTTSLSILIVAALETRKKILSELGNVFLISAGISLAFVSGLFVVGRLSPPKIPVTRLDNGDISLVSHGLKKSQEAFQKKILFFPEDSVFGESFGKELRRFAATEQNSPAKIYVPIRFDGIAATSPPPDIIISSGNRHSEGIKALKIFPNARLILLHPFGKPETPKSTEGDVTVFLPFVDSHGTSRLWKRAARTHSWRLQTNMGVGQDIRLIWPDSIDLLGRDTP